MQLKWRWRAAQEVVANVRPKLRNDSDMTQAPFSLPSGHHMAIIFKSATSSQMESDTKFTTFFLDIASPSIFSFNSYRQYAGSSTQSRACTQNITNVVHALDAACVRYSERSFHQKLQHSPISYRIHLSSTSSSCLFHMNQTIFALTSKH